MGLQRGEEAPDSGPESRVNLDAFKDRMLKCHVKIAWHNCVLKHVPGQWRSWCCRSFMFSMIKQFPKQMFARRFHVCPYFLTLILMASFSYSNRLAMVGSAPPPHFLVTVTATTPSSLGYYKSLLIRLLGHTKSKILLTVLLYILRF